MRNISVQILLFPVIYAYCVWTSLFRASCSAVTYGNISDGIVFH